MRAESNDEYCSSSMPPKFIGSEADSDISILDFRFWILDCRDFRSDLGQANPKSKIQNAYGTSIVMSLPAKLKFGRLRPFMNFAAVCESAVMIIGSAIEGSA